MTRTTNRFSREVRYFRLYSPVVDIDLQFGTEQPLSVGYEFADGTGAVEYLVAPRITAN